MQSTRQIQNIQTDQRNNKIASILTLIITISTKIQKIKQKLCGFSPVQFSPESIFDALDLTSKGHLDIYDVHSFLRNDHIQDRDIEVLFNKLGDENNKGKMTYLGFLNLLKPFFNHQLAKDLLLRDTFIKKGQQQEPEYELQETVLVLLNELLFLNCVLIAEHQGLKQTLMQEYMLNTNQLSKILGIQSKLGGLKALYEFIIHNCQYEIQQNQVKYLLSYLQTSQYTLSSEKNINTLFLPSKLKTTTKGKKTLKVQSTREIKQKEQLYAHYNDTFISKNDMISNKKSFLNYIHPNSMDRMPQTQKKNDHKQLIRDNNRGQNYQVNVNMVSSNMNNVRSREHTDRISQQEHRVPAPPSKFIKQFMKPNNNHSNINNLKSIRQLQQNQSKIQNSNLFNRNKSRNPVHLQESRIINFQTPILEQFMHPNNIKVNLGNTKDRFNQNNVVREGDYAVDRSKNQSSLSQSDAIQRVQSYQNQNHTRSNNPNNMQNLKKSPQQQHHQSNSNSLNVYNTNFAGYEGVYQKFSQQNQSRYINDRSSYMNNSNQNQNQNRKYDNLSSQSGILGQFYKQGLK